MKVKASSCFVLGVIMVLIPSSLSAGGGENGEKKILEIRRINVRPRPVSALQSYDLSKKSTNLVSLGSTHFTSTKTLTPQEEAELSKNFRLVSGTRKNTKSPNK